MANITETPAWAPVVDEIDTSDKVLGGPDGVINVQAKQLADRTAYLKQEVEEAAAAAGVAGVKADQALGSIEDIEVAAGSATAAAAAALAHRDAAQAAEALAVVARNAAQAAGAQSADNAQFAVTAAGTATLKASEAGSAATAAVSAAGSSVTARDLTLAARDVAVSAQDVAVVAADEAAVSAAAAAGSAIEAAASADVEAGQAALLRADIAAPTGSALVGFQQAGGVARTAESKLRDLEVSVDEFGADGTGAASSANSVEAADAALLPGGKLVFGKNKTYLFDRQTNIRNAGTVDLNGSTLKAAPTLTTAMIRHGERLADYPSVVAFSVTKNQIVVTLPAGVTAARGDLIGFKSNTERLTDYKHGMWAVAAFVSGSTVFLSTPFYDGFQVDSMEVWRGYEKMEFCNGTLDLTEINAVANFSEGLLSRGTNIHVHHINAYGNDNAGVGIRTDGENAIVEKSLAFGFLNTLGEPSGGKIGYGIAVYGNNSKVIDCSAAFCKHGIASAARDKVAVNVTYENCNVYEDTVFVSNKYSGSIDMHPNVTGVAEILRCNVVGQFRLLSVRCPVKVSGGKYEQTIGGQMVATFEGPYTGLEIDGIKYRLASVGSSIITINSSNFAAVNAVTGFKFKNNEALGVAGKILNIERISALTDVEITGNKHAGGSILRHAGGNLSHIKISKNRVTVNESAIRVFMAGSLYSANDVRIEENRIERTVSTSGEDLVTLLSTDASRIAAPRLSIVGNELINPSDTGTSYAMQLTKVSATDASICKNKMNRASFRCAQFGGCSFVRTRIAGNVMDGNMFTSNASLATVLTDVTVSENIGVGYSVAVDALGVTKTRYVDGLNNFVTYTP